MNPLTTDPLFTLTGATRVVAVVIRRGDRYLVGQRPAHKRHGGLWEFTFRKADPHWAARSGNRPKNLGSRWSQSGRPGSAVGIARIECGR